MLSSSIITPKYQWASGALEIRKHVELAEPVDEPFYRWSQICPLDRYVVTLHRAQWALARWIMTPLIKSVTRLRQPVRKAKFCYWTCHHTFHFSQIKSCIFPACFHSAFFFFFLSHWIHWHIATMPTNINSQNPSRQMYCVWSVLCEQSFGHLWKAAVEQNMQRVPGQPERISNPAGWPWPRRQQTRSATG